MIVGKKEKEKIFFDVNINANCMFQEFPGFIKQVVDQTEINLRRIHKLGVKKIAMASLQPLGCTAITGFQRCNALVSLHNTLLHQAVAKLNNETQPSTFVILDLYNAFLTVLKNKGAIPGKPKGKVENQILKCFFFFFVVVVWYWSYEVCEIAQGLRDLCTRWNRVVSGSAKITCAQTWTRRVRRSIQFVKIQRLPSFGTHFIRPKKGGDLFTRFYIKISKSFWFKSKT